MPQTHSPSIAIIRKRGVPTGLRYSELDGGTINFLETLSAFIKSKWDVHVFTASNGPEFIQENVRRVTIHRIGLPHDYSSEGMSRDLAEGVEFSEALLRYGAFSSREFDYVHTHHWSSAVPPLLLGKSGVLRHVHTPHLLAIEKMRALGLVPLQDIIKAEASILRSADKIIALSESEKQAITDFYGVQARRISVIRNGISNTFMRHRLDPSFVRNAIGSNPMRVISVGRIVRQKGYDVLLRAIAIVHRAGIPIECVIVGGDYNLEKGCRESLIQQALELGIESVVSFTGSLRRPEIVGLMRCSSLYLQTSRYESQGIAIIEAMAMGLPVVASRLPAVEEIFEHGKNGHLVDVEDYEAVADAILYLRARADLVEQMSATNSGSARHLSWRQTRMLTLACFANSTN